MPTYSDKAEWKRWARRGWNPAWLENCLEELGPLKEAVPWDRSRRDQFADRWAAARQTGQDAYYTSRVLLQQEIVGRGGIRIRPVIAFRSEKEMRAAIQPDIQAKVDQMAFFFQHAFLVPDSDIEFDLDLLKRAVDLAKDPDYKKARTDLYDWQEDRVVKGYTDAKAIDEMKELIARYDAKMKGTKWKNVRYACFAAALAIPVAKEMALIGGATALAAGAGVKVIEFISGKNESNIPESLAPAVALHTVRKELKLREPKLGS
jgi:hypothetical protein